MTFFDNACYFIDYSSKVLDVLGNNADNLGFIQNQIEELRSQIAKVCSSFLKLFIYFEQSPFTETADKYYDSTVKIQHSAIKLLYGLEKNVREYNLLLDSFKMGQVNYQNELIKKKQARKDLMETHATERQAILYEIYNNRTAYVLELSKLLKVN
ncbi:MAG: hypothetical protein LBQ31_02040 [Bacteroidales bacterium]|nr:hypothetical protein [Bacteroidales bacterium]